MGNQQYGIRYCTSLKLRTARASAEFRVPNSILSFMFGLIWWFGLMIDSLLFDKLCLLKFPEHSHSYFTALLARIR